MADTAEDKEKIEITREELEEIIDQRVEERLQDMKGREKESGEDDGQDELSRRSFLKKLGAGTIGIGALSLIPSASALNIRSDGLSFYGGSSSGIDLDVDNSGKITTYGSLDVNGNDIVDGGTTVWDSTGGQIPSSVVQSSGLDADTLDGSDASDLGGDELGWGKRTVKSTGTTYYSAAGTYTGTTQVSPLTTDKRKRRHRIKAVAAFRYQAEVATATAKLKRNGSTVVSKSNQANATIDRLTSVKLTSGDTVTHYAKAHGTGLDGDDGDTASWSFTVSVYE